MNQMMTELRADERIDEVNERLRLIQKKQGLTFGTDAYLLAAFPPARPRSYAVELGAGTGIVSLLLARKEKVRKILAVEIQPAFAELIDRNAALNGLSDRVRGLCRDLRELDGQDLGFQPDLVLANPPYLRPDSGRLNEAEEKRIARHELFGNVGDFCACAARLLGTKGRFVCVWRPERLPELFGALAKSRLEPKRMALVHADVTAPPCMVLVEAVLGASPGLLTLPPLLLYEPRELGAQRRTMTRQTLAIYETCSFPDSGRCK